MAVDGAGQPVVVQGELPQSRNRTRVTAGHGASEDVIDAHDRGEAAAKTVRGCSVPNAHGVRAL
jgi:hypothetical protein